jgi:drug/metabolite transporter (DMT)-like permease
MGFIFIVLGTLMWSIDTLIRYPLLASVQTSTLVFTEHAVLIAIFGAIILIKKNSLSGFRKKLNATSISAFLVIGVIGSAVSTLAFTKAFYLINPSLVILLQKLQPIVVIFLSSYLLKENIKNSFYFYFVLALTGVLLISYPDLASLDISNATSFGYLLTLLAVGGWGASTVFGKKLSLMNFNENEILIGRFSLGFLFLLVYCLSNNTLPSSQLSSDVYLKILGMVLISGLIGMSLYYKGLKLVPAHIGSIAELFFPLSAVVINWIFLGKALQPIQIVGACILTAASVAIQFHHQKK